MERDKPPAKHKNGQSDGRNAMDLEAMKSNCEIGDRMANIAMLPIQAVFLRNAVTNSSSNVSCLHYFVSFTLST